MKKTVAPSKPASSASPARKFFVVLLLLASGILLFSRLDHYALWDDEAGTALNAVAVWRTGDTTALIDHNLVAYQNGKDLSNLKERFMPPLPAYVAAPFIGLLGQKAWAARLPFAIAGLLCVGLMLRWLWKTESSLWEWTAFSLALLGSASFFLFFKQCRYYGLTILATTALAYLYCHWDGRRRNVVLFAAISLCLFASNYLNYAALYAALVMDYGLWGRQRIRLSAANWGILLLPQIVFGSIVFWIWNPLAKASPGLLAEAVTSKMTLFWWYWRDSVLEFSNPVLLAVACLLCFFRDNRWLLRALVCLLVYISVITVAAPPPPVGNEHIEVRYLAACIPLFLVIGVLTVQFLTRSAPPVVVPLAFLAFAVNWHPVAYGPPRLHMAMVDYLRELIKPPSDPYTVAARWIQQHVAEKESIWVWPGYMAYPLMFHEPKAVYAWQLTFPPKEDQFKKLERIHFQNQLPPDYIIAFGPDIEMLFERMLARPRPGFEYQLVDTLDFYWNPLHRPEFLRHSFTPTTDYDKTTEAIYILKRAGRK